ncbi:MAG: DUF429 domain-containing protein [Vicinamibacterales bacterium]
MEEIPDPATVIPGDNQRFPLTPSPSRHGGVRTLGIDFATEPTAAAFCMIDWAGPAPRIVEGPSRPVHRDWSDLHDRIGKADKVAIDVPLGWPVPFTEAIAAHAGRKPWPSPRADCLLRTTDKIVAGMTDSGGGRRRAPLSVSANLIGATAMEAASMLSRYAVDRSGVRGAICEVYPAVALRCWDLPDVGYKGTSPAAAPIRGAIVEGLAGALHWLRGDPRTVGLLRLNDDFLDAFVCALLARLVAIGRANGPCSSEAQRLAEIEGWIWIPVPNALAALNASGVEQPPALKAR